MLAQGKVGVDEADQLLAAVERSPAQDGESVEYLRVLVDGNDEHEGPTKVNVRVPMQLLRDLTVDVDNEQAKVRVFCE